MISQPTYLTDLKGKKKKKKEKRKKKTLIARQKLYTHTKTKILKNEKS
jgi:hypothetical protein